MYKNQKTPNSRLYVGELDHKVTVEVLKELFSRYGTVLSTTLSKSQSPDLNFGFISMSSLYEARACVENLNNFIVNDNPIIVRF